ncbi:WXG100 family type VII secretion target [Actinomadura rupiterrae]|uniref:WXG100 family type VII secretion target n=1 Tax=Actinomadura rupiterrae TaxID=559627 RepID=UPI0020A332C2|nr:WXG100 family type VII secretion target [Actinomadura rupiterrae]MCP2343647.1 WXG100 family type VII secretion target [Actinomadura rupiterrae]
MSESYTKANFGTMQQAQADFTLAYRALIDELSDLEKELEKHLQQWEGDAVSAYWDAKRQWDSAAQHIGTVLNQLGVVIGEAHQNYSAAERKNSGIWGA